MTHLFSSDNVFKFVFNLLITLCSFYFLVSNSCLCLNYLYYQFSSLSNFYSPFSLFSPFFPSPISYPLSFPSQLSIVCQMLIFRISANPYILLTETVIVVSVSVREIHDVYIQHKYTHKMTFISSYAHSVVHLCAHTYIHAHKHIHTHTHNTQNTITLHHYSYIPLLQINGLLIFKD